MSALKNNPLLLAVLGVAAWYLFTQQSARAGRTVGKPNYGKQGALVNPAVRAYQVPPQLVAQPSWGESLLRLSTAWLGRAPAPAPVSHGGSLVGAYDLGPVTPQDYAYQGQILTGAAASPWSLGSPALLGDYGWADGAGVVDQYIGSSAPELLELSPDLDTLGRWG